MVEENIIFFWEILHENVQLNASLPWKLKLLPTINVLPSFKFALKKIDSVLNIYNKPHYKELVLIWYTLN